ncbi:hypothetical protein Hypma_014674 [Hypsizygus marmoreus]|uniref:Uncharacterized protein n=1 Tax=Hypsizygus marmoreus TaxID=39966 RepID=A0A369JE43_HYPMA|nr:hypothetical protein Hypma_014674 [Hypsizygus marmoreus]
MLVLVAPLPIVFPLSLSRLDPKATCRMEPHIYFIRHPRYIKTKAEELVSFLLADSGPEAVTSCDIALDAATALYSAALQNSRYSRTVALIARATIVELQWHKVEDTHATLHKELADLITSNFIMNWMEEFGRGCSPDTDISPEPPSPELTLDDLETRLDQYRFDRSNPRLEESVYEDLYEELDETTTICPAVAISNSGGESFRFPEEMLRSLSTVLGDFYSVGIIHPNVMQTCVVYIIDHLYLREDAQCLHVLLNRAATHLAPSFGLCFLQRCRYSIMLAATTTSRGAFPDVLAVLDLIDELIAGESKSPNNPNVALYAQRSCHRWDPAIVDDLSFKT